LRAKDLTNGNEQKAPKDVRKDNSKLRGIENPPKCGVNVIAVLQDVGKGKCNVHASKTLDMTHESQGIVHWGAGVTIIVLGTGNKSVSQTLCVRSIWPISTVNTDAAFALADGPLDWIDHEAVNEVEQETRQMNGERFFLLYCKLGL
jgi:hypothetical protein